MYLIIFDLDGTLFNSETSVLPAVQEALKNIGLPASKVDFILSLMGEETRNFCTKLLSSYGKEGMEKYDDFLKALWVSEAKHIKINGELYDGIRDILEKLSVQGHILTICSNATTEYIDYVLETQGIGKYFDLIKSAESMTDKGAGVKELMESVEHSKAVMVGDRTHDLEAARVNSIPFIGVLYGYGREEIRDAEYAVKYPVDIAEIIGDMS